MVGRITFGNRYTNKDIFNDMMKAMGYKTKEEMFTFLDEDDIIIKDDLYVYGTEYDDCVQDVKRGM